MSEQPFTLAPGSRFRLKEFDPAWTGCYQSKGQAKQRIKENLRRLNELQEMLFAQDNRALLIVLQGMDTAGKDGAIKHVMGAFNPQGVHVTSFKVPTKEEYAHDFLWRIHRAVPSRRMVGIFNRSHYEDVLAARVLEIVTEDVWGRRYEQINSFERLVADSGVFIVKLFLHISKEAQAQRLLERQQVPRKQWKFSPGDLDQRKLWADYTAAFEDALSMCNTEHAPWYVIPADRKWYRNLAVSEILLQTMESMELSFPEPVPDIESYAIPE